MDLIRELADQIVSQTDDLTDLGLRKGVVVSVQSATSVTVRVGGSTTNIAGVQTLEPLAAGNVVWLLQQGPLLLAIGKPGGTPAPTSVTAANRLNVADDRNQNRPPSYYQADGRNFRMEFATGSTLGLHGSLTGEAGGFVTLITMVKWSDDSGGRVTQIAFSHVASGFGTAPVGSQYWMAMRQSNGASAWHDWAVHTFLGVNNASGTRQVGSLNASLASGFYETPPGANGSPSNDWYTVVHTRHTNVNDNRYQAQMAFHFFTGRAFWRINPGGDPTQAGSWGPWYQLHGHAEYDEGGMYRSTDYSSGSSGDVVFPWTSGTGNGADNNIYWDGGTRLYVKRRGLYVWTCGMTYNQQYGLTQLSMRHNSGGHFASLRYNDYVYARTLTVTGMLLMNAGDWVDVIVIDPSGFHPGGFVINPFCKGQRLG